MSNRCKIFGTKDFPCFLYIRSRKFLESYLNAVNERPKATAVFLVAIKTGVNLFSKAHIFKASLHRHRRVNDRRYRQKQEQADPVQDQAGQQAL